VDLNIEGHRWLPVHWLSWEVKLSQLVLIAEDEPFIRESLQFILERSGLSVVTSSDGKGAMQSIRDLRPGLVILDVKMQHHSGFDVLKMIRADPELSETKVLILTALRLKEEYRIAIELGADKYVTKPFSNQALVADVHQLLGLS
jgi:two-component system OmpR family response regulator